MSLYDLFQEHFSGDMDAREAELELGRFRWKPFDRDDKGMNVIVFRGHVERLMKRAGLTLSFPRIRTICNCLPPRFKDHVEMETSETRLWDQIKWVPAYFLSSALLCSRFLCVFLSMHLRMLFNVIAVPH